MGNTIEVSTSSKNKINMKFPFEARHYVVKMEGTDLLLTPTTKVEGALTVGKDLRLSVSTHRRWGIRLSTSNGSSYLTACKRMDGVIQVYAAKDYMMENKAPVWTPPLPPNTVFVPLTGEKLEARVKVGKANRFFVHLPFTAKRYAPTIKNNILVLTPTDDEVDGTLVGEGPSIGLGTRKLFKVESVPSDKNFLNAYRRPDGRFLVPYAPEYVKANGVPSFPIFTPAAPPIAPPPAAPPIAPPETPETPALWRRAIANMVRDVNHLAKREGVRLCVEDGVLKARVTEDIV